MDFRNFWGRFSAIFSFVLCAKVDFAVCHNFKNVKITLLNVFDKLQYIPETFNRKIHLEINQTNEAASEFSLARCFRLSHLFLQGSIIEHN